MVWKGVKRDVNLENKVMFALHCADTVADRAASLFLQRLHRSICESNTMWQYIISMVGEGVTRDVKK